VRTPGAHAQAAATHGSAATIGRAGVARARFIGLALGAASTAKLEEQEGAAVTV
jgi:hypothetical protein